MIYHIDSERQITSSFKELTEPLKSSLVQVVSIKLYSRG